MRFTTAWANILSQNVTLRVTLLIVSTCAVVFAISTARLSMRAPLIIDRGCISIVETPSRTEHTQTEIESFIWEALPKRFDTVAADSVLFLSDEENGFRVKEQSDFQKKGITQRILPVRESIKIEGNVVRLDTDRILSMGKLKSILPFPLVVELASSDRTQGNPYGLVIKNIKEAVQSKESEEGK